MSYEVQCAAVILTGNSKYAFALKQTSLKLQPVKSKHAFRVEINASERK